MLEPKNQFILNRNNKKLVFIIGDGVIAIQNLLHENQYTLHVFEPIYEALVPVQNASSIADNRWSLNLFLM